KAVLKKINYLFRDRHANVAGSIDPELIDHLVDIRTRLGLPPTIVFEILSGYRTRKTNERLAWSNAQVAKESLHMHGWAVDFRVAHV
ncbi:YcbK family protein, partial [Escherichia coli]|uniref:YcbK family protein n=1 Tax=Escherichia coli TaxID=562 RepID=UPI0039DF4BED